MKYCLLSYKNEVVQVQPYMQYGFIECDDDVVCGMVKDVGGFIIPYVEPVAVVPKVITMRQARLALLQSNLLTAVCNAITTGTDEAMKIEWEYATEVRRDWSSLITMTEAIGLTSLQLDNLFKLGSTL